MKYWRNWWHLLVKSTHFSKPNAQPDLFLIWGWKLQFSWKFPQCVLLRTFLLIGLNPGAVSFWWIFSWRGYFWSTIVAPPYFCFALFFTLGWPTEQVLSKPFKTVLGLLIISLACFLVNIFFPFFLQNFQFILIVLLPFNRTSKRLKGNCG